MRGLPAGKLPAITLSIVVAGFAALSHAAEIDFDLTNVSVQAVLANGTTPTSFPNAGFTGGLKFSLGTSPSIEVSKDIDDGNGLVTLTNLPDTLTSFGGVAYLTNGLITSGNLTLGIGSKTYTFSVAAPDSAYISDLSSVNNPFYLIGADSFNGAFSSSIFDGMNVSQWTAASPLGGDITLEGFKPNASGLSEFTSVGITVVTPEPTCVSVLAIGSSFLLSRRRKTV